jgi:hypothetical protein
VGLAPIKLQIATENSSTSKFLSVTAGKYICILANVTKVSLRVGSLLFQRFFCVVANTLTAQSIVLHEICQVALKLKYIQELECSLPTSQDPSAGVYPEEGDSSA